MRLKNIIFIGILFFSINSYAQQQNSDYEGFYISTGYEIGLLSVDLKGGKPPIKSCEVNSRLRHSIPFFITYKNAYGFDFQLGYLPSQNAISFKGSDIGKSFKITNNYFSHTGFASIGYNFAINNFLDIRAGLGISMTFVGDDNIPETQQGTDHSSITITNITENNKNTHIVIPLSISKHFRNGNQITFGAKYYRSINKSFINGFIRINESYGAVKQTNYSTLNNAIALFLTYGFKIETTTEDCGCLF